MKNQKSFGKLCLYLASLETLLLLEYSVHAVVLVIDLHSVVGSTMIL